MKSLRYLLFLAAVGFIGCKGSDQPTVHVDPADRTMTGGIVEDGENVTDGGAVKPFPSDGHN